VLYDLVSAFLVVADNLVPGRYGYIVVVGKFGAYDAAWGCRRVGSGRAVVWSPN